jgi:Sec-independent protein translocase protein TatA
VGDALDDKSHDPAFDNFAKAIRNFKSASNASNKEEQLAKLKEQIKTQLSSLRQESGVSQQQGDDESLTSSKHMLQDESDSEYEDNGSQGRILVKESKRGPFVPNVSESVRMDESVQSAIQGMQGDLSEQLGHLDDYNFYNPRQLNYTMPQRDSSEFPFEGLEDFVPNTDPSKFREDEQVGVLHILISMLFTC